MSKTENVKSTHKGPFPALRINYYILFYKAKEINASSSLGKAYFFFTFNARACVSACVCCVNVFSYYIFFTMVCILFRINFQIHLISHALRLAGSVSIGAVVGFRRKIDHHWLMFFLYRDLL